MDREFAFLPEATSSYAGEVDGLFLLLTGITAFFTLLIALSLLYFAIKYRRRSAHEVPRPIAGSLRLELFWTIVPLIIVLFIFYRASSVFFTMITPPADTMEIYVTGRQWMWMIQHAGGQREINQLHVPVGRPVKLTMTSVDVIHSFYVPAFRNKMDVLPGRYTTLWFEATKPGTYHIFCAEYCGTNHSAMVGTVTVMEPTQFQKWLASRADDSLADKGRKLFQNLHCLHCHSADTQAKAPLLENVYGKKVTLEGGQVLDANEAYLRESILNPRAKVVAGYKPIMPPYQGQISEEQMVHLMAFLRSLGPGQTPPRVENAELPPFLQELVVP